MKSCVKSCDNQDCYATLNSGIASKANCQLRLPVSTCLRFSRKFQRKKTLLIRVWQFGSHVALLWFPTSLILRDRARGSRGSRGPRSARDLTSFDTILVPRALRDENALIPGYAC